MSEARTAGAAKAPAATPSTLFGFCGTEAKSDAGPAGLGSEWHQRCPGAVRTGRGLVRCSCPAHDEDRKCHVCLTEVEPSEEYDEIERRHVDFEACQIANDLRTAATRAETARVLAAVKDDVKNLRAARRATRPNNGATDMPNPRNSRSDSPLGTLPARPRRPKAEPQRCHDGCGGMTKGGRFLAGHDAKLKSALSREAGGHEGYVAQLAERIARGWLPTASNPAWAERPEMVDVINEAQKVVDEAGPDQYIAARVAARYEQNA